MSHKFPIRITTTAGPNFRALSRSLPKARPDWLAILLTIVVLAPLAFTLFAFAWAAIAFAAVGPQLGVTAFVCKGAAASTCITLLGYCALYFTAHRS